MKKPDPAEYNLSASLIKEIEVSRETLENTLTRTGLIGGYLISIAGLWKDFSLLAFFLSIGPAFLGFFLSTGLALLINKARFPNYEKYVRAQHEYDRWFVRRQAKFWNSLSGLAFEREVATLLARSGQNVRLTPSTGDQGVDIILGNSTIIQCKAHSKPVGPTVVRELYGALKDLRAQKAILISRSGFTRGVFDFVKGKPIALWDTKSLINLQKTLDDSAMEKPTFIHAV